MRSLQRFDHTKASAGLGKSGYAAATLACAGKAQAKQLLWVWPLEFRAGKDLLARIARTVQDEQLGRNANQRSRRLRGQRTTGRRYARHPVDKSTGQRNGLTRSGGAAGQALALRAIARPACVGRSLGFADMGGGAHGDRGRVVDPATTTTAAGEKKREG